MIQLLYGNDYKGISLGRHSIGCLIKVIVWTGLSVVNSAMNPKIPHLNTIISTALKTQFKYLSNSVLINKLSDSVPWVEWNLEKIYVGKVYYKFP